MPYVTGEYKQLTLEDIPRSANKECEEKCNLALSIARLPGVINEVAVITEACSGPEEIGCCGAPEGKKTYSCPMKHRLAQIALRNPS
jgi:hypothetical protein